MSASKTIQAISIGSTCRLSYPCQHYVSVVYADGTDETLDMDGTLIISDTYWPYLRPSDREHFAYLREYVTRCLDHTQYTGFLATPATWLIKIGMFLAPIWNLFHR